MGGVRAVAEVIGIGLIAGILLTAYDGAVVGEYRWQSVKLFVYSMASGAIIFLLPYVALAILAFVIRLFVKNKWSPFRTHRFALVTSAVLAALLLWGGYYGATHPMAG